MKKRTTEEFINQVKLLSPDIEVLGQYTGYKKPVKVRCLVCGKEWETSAGNLLMGRGCKECRIKIFLPERLHFQQENLPDFVLEFIKLSKFQYNINETLFKSTIVVVRITPISPLKSE